MSGLKHLTGLFLGAGASCEAGMPLVRELTAEIKNWLTAGKFAISMRVGGFKVAAIQTA